MTIYQVDSFTEVPFSGNPAGVCILEDLMPDTWMQAVASEMNLSETAFLRKMPGDAKYALRWFTPESEVSLCGHATLASAHILFSQGMHNPEEIIRFATKSGELTAAQRDGMIEMVFPSRRVEKTDEYVELSAALGSTPLGTYEYRQDEENLYLLELSSPEEVVKLKPDFTSLAKTDARAVIVTSDAGGSEYDFVSRFFAPGVGINEDPVTGSAHCYLAPFWADRLEKERLVAYQASARGGVVFCSLEDQKIILGGNAVTVFTAEMLA